MSTVEQTKCTQAQPTQTELTPGTIFGGYRVVRKIGSGGMGTIYEVKQDLFPQSFALKILFIQGKTSKDQQDFNDRFLQEARITALLNHPGIVKTIALAHDKDTGTLYFVMEYVSMSQKRKTELLNSAFATDLNVWNKNPKSDLSSKREALSLEDLYQYGKHIKRRINPELIRRLMMEVVLALNHMHTHSGGGIIHRDIKPGNILIRENGSAALADFGIVKITDAGLRGNILGENDRSLSLRVEPGREPYHLILGTKHYMAPELRGGHPPSPQTDIYAVGATLYQLLTGELLPTDAPTPVQCGLHPVWNHIIEKCIAHSPEERYSSTQELYHALKDFPKTVRQYRLKQILYWGSGLAALFFTVSASISFLLPILISVIIPTIRPENDKLWIPRPAPELIFQFTEYPDHAVLESVHPDTCGTLQIPSHFNDKPVTLIEPDAFHTCTKLSGIYLPIGLHPPAVLSPLPIEWNCPEPECAKCKRYRSILAQLPSGTRPYTLSASPTNSQTEEEIPLEWTFKITPQFAWIKELNTEVEGISLTLPTQVREGIPVGGVCSNALKHANVRHLIVPSTIVNYEPEAFAQMSQLVFATIPKGNLKHATGLFNSCPKLQAVKLDLSGTELPEDCFKNCPKLRLIDLTNTSDDFRNSLEQFTTEETIPWHKMHASLRDIRNNKTLIITHNQDEQAVYILEQQRSLLPLIRSAEKNRTFTVHKATKEEIAKLYSIYIRLSPTKPLNEKSAE